MRIIFILSLILFSCTDGVSTDASSQKNSAKNTSTKQKAPNKVCSIDVEGMVCKMGCVASIKKELNAINGIAAVEIDFKEDELVQQVKVSYNDRNVEESMIEKTIETINNEQFNVLKVRTENLID